MHSSVSLLLARSYIGSSQIGRLLSCLSIKENVGKETSGISHETNCNWHSWPMHCQKPHGRTILYWWSVIISQIGQRAIQYNIKRPLLLLRSGDRVLLSLWVPRQLHSYQETIFESKMFAEVCKLLNIEKARYSITPPIRWTFIKMLCGKIKEDQKDWDH